MIHVLVRSNPRRRFLLLYYIDPLTGREVMRSSKTRDRREAERAAARWESELFGGRSARETSWEVFRVRFTDEHLAGMPQKSRSAYKTALNRFELVIGKPLSIATIDAGVLSRFQSELRRAKHPQTTINTYVKHVVSALSWANKLGMIDRVPKCVMPRNRKRKLMRSQPITEEQYEAILAAVGKDGRDPAGLNRLVRGLWLSGLRLGEAIALSWDAGAMRVSLDGRRPRIVIRDEGQKSRSDEVLPITPDFYAFLAETPATDRRGKVFPVAMPRRDVQDAISAAGKDASAVVSETGKTATSHDFRRAFGTRWALVVHPLILQRMMRHKNVETTMRYYIDLDADKVADELWEAVAVRAVAVLEKCPESAPE